MSIVPKAAPFTYVSSGRGFSKRNSAPLARLDELPAPLRGLVDLTSHSAKRTQLPALGLAHGFSGDFEIFVAVVVNLETNRVGAVFGFEIFLQRSGGSRIWPSASI